MSILIAIGLILVSLAVASLVVIAGLAVACVLVERSRVRTQRTLDDRNRRLREVAAALNDDLRSSSHVARVRLIRAAHESMTTQVSAKPSSDRRLR